MATVDLQLIQQLRERTGAGMMDCKKALQETDGDIEAAIEILKKRGRAIAEKRAGQATAEGIIHAYIHPGSRIGVLIEINCETDFVARTSDTIQFANDICLHITAMKPQFVGPEDMDQAFIEKQKARFIEELVENKKPAAMIEQIVAGKIQKLQTEVCLLKQAYVRNDQITVEDKLRELIAKVGENVRIRRFVRFEIGA